MLSENSRKIAADGYRPPPPHTDWCHFTPFAFGIEDVDGASKLCVLSDTSLRALAVHLRCVNQWDSTLCGRLRYRMSFSCQRNCRIYYLFCHEMPHAHVQYRQSDCVSCNTGSRHKTIQVHVEYDSLAVQPHGDNHKNWPRNSFGACVAGSIYCSGNSIWNN